MAVTVVAHGAYLELAKPRARAFPLDPQEALELARLLDEFAPTARAGAEGWAKLREANPAPLQRGALSVRVQATGLRIEREDGAGFTLPRGALAGVNRDLVARAHEALGPRRQVVWLRGDLAAWLHAWRPRAAPHLREPVQKLAHALDLLLRSLGRDGSRYELDAALAEACALPRRERAGWVPLEFVTTPEVEARFDAFFERTRHENLDFAVNSALAWAHHLERKQQDLARYHERFS